MKAMSSQQQIKMTTDHKGEMCQNRMKHDNILLKPEKNYIQLIKHITIY